MDAETRRYIDDTIRKQLNIILSGVSGSNTVSQETISELFPGMPEIVNRPVSHPFGYASRATQGTVQVTARHGEHVGNRMIIGHRDSKRPDDLQEGESVIYSKGGLTVYLRNGEIQIGSKNSDNPVVLFNELSALLESILDHIIGHTHVDGVGAKTSPPIEIPDFEEDKANIETIQSKKVFTEK